VKQRKARGPGRPSGKPVVQVHPNFPLGKTPAANCACRNPDSTARFTITIDGHAMCSWCGGDLSLLEDQ
jgi:hypothetical protein